MNENNFWSNDRASCQTFNCSNLVNVAISQILNLQIIQSPNHQISNHPIFKSSNFKSSHLQILNLQIIPSPNHPISNPSLISSTTPSRSLESQSYLCVRLSYSSADLYRLRKYRLRCHLKLLSGAERLSDHTGNSTYLLGK